MTGRKGGVTEQAATAAIEQGCRMLRLPTIRERFGEVATAAQREQLTYLGYLAELVMAECDDRDKRRAARRIHDAGFPRPKRVEEFDFDANKAINPATIHQLASCAWVKAGHPLCLIGDSGTGKSHLLIALGTAAAESGYRVRYTLASKLVNELVEAADDKQLSKTITRYGRVDLLCLDELGYMELDRRGAELLFQVLTEREERSAVAIASNEPFSGWTKTFTDPRLCAAIVDRLTFAGQIIETGTTSYRLAHARASRKAAATSPGDPGLRSANRTTRASTGGVGMFAVAGTWTMDSRMREFQERALPALVDGVKQNPGFIRGFWTSDVEDPATSVTFIVFETLEQARSFRDAVMANAPGQADAGVERSGLRIVELIAEA